MSKAVLDLCVDRRALARRAVDLAVVQEIAVARGEQGPADAAAPAPTVASPNSPQIRPARSRLRLLSSVSACRKVSRVEAVELASARQGEGCCAESNGRSSRPGSADAAGQVAIAVLVAVVRRTRRCPSARCQPSPPARLPLSLASDPDAEARRKPNEPASLPSAKRHRSASTPSTAMTPPTASEPQSADCGPRTTSIRDVTSAFRSFEPRLVAGCRIVGADAVDEQQGVVVLRAADADFGQRSGRPGRGDRRPTASAAAGQGPAARPAVRCCWPSMTVTLAGVSPASSGARSAVMTISVVGTASINSSSSMTNMSSRRMPSEHPRSTAGPGRRNGRRTKASV